MNDTTIDAVPMAMPQTCIAVAIPIIVISIISLATSLMWFLMQHYHSERWGYVALMALLISCSTLASIIQQFWYMTHWRHDRTSEYEQAKIGVEKPTLAIGPLTLGPSLVLFWIQMYCYNATSALVLCWAIALVRGVYNCRAVGSIRFKEILVPATKACCILLPIVMVTIPFAPSLEKHPIASLIITCTPMFCCWLVGSICVVAILVKYVRGLARFARIENSKSTDISLNTSGGRSQSASETDRWLLLRFTFSFLALSAFEVLTVNTAFSRYENCKRLAALDGPDFSDAGTIGSILTFIPGIMVGFIGFIVFGTTSFFRKIYAESMRDCCGLRRSRKSRDDRSASARAREEVEDGRSWKALGNGGGRVPTYHCRVESAGTRALELTGVGRDVGEKRDGVARTMQPQKSPAKAKPPQPWKTLGIDPP